MSGKIPNLKKLRSLVNNFDNKLNSRNSQSPLLISQGDEESQSALRTKSKSSQNKDYDKDLICKLRQEMDLIDKDLKHPLSPDDLCLSSDSECSKLSSSFRLTKSSRFFRNNSTKPKPVPKDSQLDTALETIKRLNKEIEERDKKILLLEQKLSEKENLAENTLKKLSKNTKFLESNEKTILTFKKECEEKLIYYEKLITNLEDENKDLHKKLNTLENDNKSFEDQNKTLKSKLQSSDDLKKQNSDLRKKFEDFINITQNLQQRYESLVESSMVFEEKTRNLYKANQILQENIIKLLPES